MDINELLLTALRATFVYFYLLIIVRILGKREIGAWSMAFGQFLGKLQESID